MALLRPDIVYYDDVKRRVSDLDRTEYDWIILAEGDSWFSIGALPSSNLLFEMRFKRWTQILSLATPGDTMLNMSDLAANGALKKVLADKRFNYRFDAMLLSGGGNDVIDAAPSLILKQKARQGDGSLPEHYVNMKALQVLLDDIAAGYKRIVELRDAKNSQSQSAPIFVHTYDYATPRNAPARFLSAVPLQGPWLYKAFADQGMNPFMQQRVADLLINNLCQALINLDCEQGDPSKRLPAFHVIDTRNTLVRANATEVGNSNDWLNEIHPNHDGYRKVADRLSNQVNARLSP